jgi:hypothetical protein
MSSAIAGDGSPESRAAPIDSRKVAMASFHTIVVALDFSDISGDVLETGRDMARLNHSRLQLIHAVGDPFRSMYAVETTVSICQTCSASGPKPRRSG